MRQVKVHEQCVILLHHHKLYGSGAGRDVIDRLRVESVGADGELVRLPAGADYREVPVGIGHAGDRRSRIGQGHVRVGNSNRGRVDQRAHVTVHGGIGTGYQHGVSGAVVEVVHAILLGRILQVDRVQPGVACLGELGAPSLDGVSREFEGDVLHLGVVIDLEPSILIGHGGSELPVVGHPCRHGDARDDLALLQLGYVVDVSVQVLYGLRLRFGLFGHNGLRIILRRQRLRRKRQRREERKNQYGRSQTFAFHDRGIALADISNLILLVCTFMDIIIYICQTKKMMLV